MSDKEKLVMSFWYEHDGREYAPGDALSVEPDIAARLVRDGYARRVEDKPEAPKPNVVVKPVTGK